MRRRTVKRTLSNQKLWWRLQWEPSGLPYWKVYSNAACTNLVALIPASCLFDADGNWFAENA